MASVSVYLNFRNQCEAAFTRYREVFGAEFEGELHRFKDMPPQPGCPALDAETAELVMHVTLPILGGFKLMGCDAPEGLCGPFQEGSSIHINLQPDSRAEADRLFVALAEGGQVTMPMDVMFWGDYFGSCTDRFGIRWMINCSAS
ncbi:VOC family protein [Pseudorhodoferax sp.]|uniref:VOC family protein n=1 Tax=Pseudorhodoferax sp. TaxID=1993553 RepID=UPI001B65F00F|nr:VOC family protein [Pseudorhodoferax sp.]MBP8144896.1 VOC family protein [Inhella sp.]